MQFSFIKNYFSGRGKLLNILYFCFVLLCFSVLAMIFYDNKIVKYIWLFAVFWVTASSIPKFFIELIMRKKFNEFLIISIVIVILFSVCFDAGKRVIIFGFMMGLLSSLIVFMTRGCGTMVYGGNKVKNKKRKKN